MADIYLDLEQLSSEIITLNNKKLQELDKAMKTASNTVATLAAYGWSGEAKDAFMEKFVRYKLDMKAFSENVKEFNKQLKTIQSDGRKLISQGSKVANKL